MYLTCNAEQRDFQTFALCIGTWSHSLCKWHISSKAKNVNNHQDGGSWLHPCSSLTCNVTWNVGNMCSHSSLGGGGNKLLWTWDTMATAFINNICKTRARCQAERSAITSISGKCGNATQTWLLQSPRDPNCEMNEAFGAITSYYTAVLYKNTIFCKSSRTSSIFNIFVFSIVATEYKILP